MGFTNFVEPRMMLSLEQISVLRYVFVNFDATTSRDLMTLMDVSKCFTRNLNKKFSGQGRSEGETQSWNAKVAATKVNV